MQQLNYRIFRILLAVIASLFLSACVTTTSGGFNADVSQEKALQDYISLSRGYLEQGDLFNAKRHLNNASKIDKNNAEIFSIWGLVYAREGEVELADDNFRRSLRVNRHNSQARNNYAAFLFANARYKDAYEQLETVVEDTEYPARSQAFENLGLSALRLNELEDAEYAFSRAVQLNRNQVRSILELVNINLLKQNFVQAELFYQNYRSILQLYNQNQNARSLWLGIQLALARGNDTALLEYGTKLSADYGSSPEYFLYQQLLENRSND